MPDTLPVPKAPAAHDDIACAGDTAPRPSAHPGMGNMLYDGGAAFRVWAPFALSVDVGFYPAADDSVESPAMLEPMAPEGNGYWSVDVPGITSGTYYRYRIAFGDPVRSHTRIDPYSRQVTDSMGLSIVLERDFPWTDDDFHMPDFRELVIYELHVGTFDDDPEGGPGTLARAAKRLGQLADLGVNCIHLMPPNEFATQFSWGYNLALPFAIESAYGGIGEFKEFINQAHRLGIAVITDCVFNHFGPADLMGCLWQFDGWQERGQGGIYFYNDKRGVTDWGPRPDFGRSEVRQFIRDYVMFLVEECRCDGLRIDSTCNIWGFDNGQGWNADGYDLLRAISDDVNRGHHEARRKILIAEDWHNDGWVTRPTTAGGAGMNAEWHWYFHDIRNALVAPSDGARDLGAVVHALTTSYDGDGLRRVIYTESHDESGNDQNLARKISPDDPESWVARKLTTLGAALTLTAPGIPMLWQGQEIHSTTRFVNEVPLDWSRLQSHAGIFRLYQDLCRLRRNWHDNTRGLRGGSLNCHLLDDWNKVLAYHRWDQGGPGDDVIVILNFSATSWDAYEIGLPQAGEWRCRFSSDWEGYSPDFGNRGGHTVHTVDSPRHGMAQSAGFTLAPYSAVIYSQAGGVAGI